MADIMCSRFLSRTPLIIILGSTGCGKSKLGIELAKKYDGEIISADSMQVYKGLDIVTNKVAKDEQRQVPHHMLDFLDPIKTFTVLDFRNQALKIIDDIIQRNKLPIVVGGTHYYIESILWHVLVENVSEQLKRTYTCDVDDSHNSHNKKIKLDLLELASNQQLHDMLMKVDPIMADRLHPNNRRKVLRSLEIYHKFGRTHSSIIQEQQEADGGSTLGGPLRFSDSLLFWIQCEQGVLDKRLDDRVDEMIDRGLVEELLQFHQQYNEHRLKMNQTPDYTKGVFQTIGFKEFHEYLLLPESERASEQGSKMFQARIEELKLVSRRYARKQTKWIRNRFLRKHDRQVPPLYSLDATNVEEWDERVFRRAEEIADCFLNNKECDKYQKVPLEDDNKISYKTFKCEICDRIFVDSLQWTAHVRSKKHAKMVKKQKQQPALTDTTVQS